MSVIDTLIYDRSQADVADVIAIKKKILEGGLSSLTTTEKSVYMAGMKGAYNYTDMNRVGEATKYVADRMTALPAIIKAYREAKGVADADMFDVPYDPSDIAVTGKSTWTMSDIPTSNDLTTYLSDIRLLKSKVTLPPTVPSLPVNMAYLTVSGANAIEQTLAAIDTAVTDLDSELKSKIDNAANAFRYTGITYCGA